MIQEIAVTGKYLLIPVRNQGDMLEAVFSAAGASPEIPLRFVPGSRQDCDFIASYPLSFFGKTLRIQAETLDWLAEVTQADAPVTAPVDCPERPQFHYSANTGWLNDPNGLYWYNGLWHMFHQYNPLAHSWENMHWHHAVSEDLIHWRELEIVIPPLPCGSAFSGGAVLDFENTSGLQENPEIPPILLFYTAHKKKSHTQRLFFSTDGGKTFQNYSDDPIIGTFGDGDDRDPSVAWDPDRKEWLMALYLGDSQWEFSLLHSKDLIHWQELQRFFMPDRGRECPELLRMRDENDGIFRWVLLEANGNYLVWERQENTMHPVSQGKFLYKGKEGYSYACQTFKNTPDGTVTGIGWQRGKIRHAAFSQSMTLPFQLRLRGGKLLTTPHPAWKMLREDVVEWHDLQPGTDLPGGKDLLELELTLPASGDLDLWLYGIPLRFHASACSLQLGDDLFPFPGNAGTFRIFLDRTSVEIYDTDGAFWCAQDVDWDRSTPLLTCSNTIPYLRCHTLRSIY